MKNQPKIAPRKLHKTRITAAPSTAANSVETVSANVNAVEVKPAVIVPNTLPVFSVEKGMLIAAQLRATASGYHQQYVVPGRKAMLEVLAEVYTLYYNAKSSREFEQFMNNVRNKLTIHNVEIRTNSQDPSLLVRLVFADFSDKKVHVYGRALEVAFSKQTHPLSFKSLVAATKNGLEGLRQQGSAKPATSDASKLAIAISTIENEQTVDTIEAVEGWKAGEKCRIFIAISNGDGMVDLKDSKLEKNHLESTLLLVKADKDRRDNPPKEQTDAVKEAVHNAMLLQNETQLKSEEAKLADLEMKLKAANSSDDNALSQALQFSIAVTTAQMDSLRLLLKSLRDGLKSKSE